MNDVLETGVIVDLLWMDHDTAKLIQTVKESGLSPEHFQNNESRAAFEEILKLADRPDAVVFRDQVIKKLGINCYERIVQNTTPSTISTYACDRISRLAEDGKKRITAEKIQTALQASLSYKTQSDMLAAINDTVLELQKSQTAGNQSPKRAISFAELTDPVPEAENPDALFANGWLRKGHAFALVSTTGVGKSVISIQLAYAWARGLPAFGICPMKPLRIGFLQTEDDEEEMKWFRQNIRRGYREVHQWTDEALNEAEKNLLLPTDFTGQSGDRFVDYLRRWQQENKCDLIIINPLQGVCGCDIAKNDELTDFVRNKIDPIITNPENKCAVMFVHHTNKPPTGRDRAGFGSDRFAEYMGAGGAELSNWLRAILTITPTGTPGLYDLQAAKRGQKLHWQNPPGDKCSKPHKMIAHSEGGLVFWKETSLSPSVTNEKEKSNPEDIALQLADVLRLEAKTLTEARNYAKETFGNKAGDAAYNAILDDLPKFGIVLKTTGISTQKLIGSEESVNRRFLELKKNDATGIKRKNGRNTSV